MEEHSIQQKNEERDFLIKQRNLLEEVLINLENVKITPFNFFKILNSLKRICIIIGGRVAACMVQVNNLSNNETEIISSIRTLQSEISTLRDKVKKLEDRNGK